MKEHFFTKIIAKYWLCINIPGFLLFRITFCNQKPPLKLKIEVFLHSPNVRVSLRSNTKTERFLINSTKRKLERHTIFK